MNAKPHHNARFCPECGARAAWSFTRFGARFDCRPCGRWGFGNKPLLNLAERNSGSRQPKTEGTKK